MRTILNLALLVYALVGFGQSKTYDDYMDVGDSVTVLVDLMPESITNIEPGTNKLDWGCEEEAMRMIKLMPAYIHRCA